MRGGLFNAALADRGAHFARVPLMAPRSIPRSCPPPPGQDQAAASDLLPGAAATVSSPAAGQEKSEGKPAAAIGAEVGADADQIRTFAQANRDVCPARPTSGRKGLADPDQDAGPGPDEQEPAPDAPAAGDAADSPAPEARPRSAVRSSAEILTIRDMWAAGATLEAIAAATGRTVAATATWISTHRGVCPKRRGTA